MGRIPNGSKVVLFLSSYSPLYLIVALRAHNAQYQAFGIEVPRYPIMGAKLSLLSILAVGLTIGSVGFLLYLIRTRRTQQGQQATIDDYDNNSDMFTEYLLVYVFPFVVFDFNDLYDVAAFGILFLTVAAIVIRSSRLYINPVLVAFRYHVYEIETPHNQYLLLSKQPLSRDVETVNTARISNGVYIATQ